MRGATAADLYQRADEIISIHTPHAGSDLEQLGSGAVCCGFQSTLPMRGATTMTRYSPSTKIFQSTLPMRGATEKEIDLLSGARISIHTPHAGSDGMKCNDNIMLYISIHTPHAGSDSKSYRIHIKFKNKIYDIRNKNKL